jgi:hypothetical protein
MRVARDHDTRILVPRMASSRTSPLIHPVSLVMPDFQFRTPATGLIKGRASLPIFTFINSSTPTIQSGSRRNSAVIEPHHISHKKTSTPVDVVQRESNTDMNKSFQSEKNSTVAVISW